MRKIVQNAVKLVCFDINTVRRKSKGDNGAIAAQWRRLSGSDDHSHVTARRDATSGKCVGPNPTVFPKCLEQNVSVWAAFGDVS